MTDPQIDRMQFDLHELTQRVELLERVAPAMPDEVTARLDRLCREMTAFQLEVLEQLSRMAPQAPVSIDTPSVPESGTQPSVADSATQPEIETLPDISYGWVGSARRA